jgi:hypothetical protein
VDSADTTAKAFNEEAIVLYPRRLLEPLIESSLPLGNFTLSYGMAYAPQT